MVTKPWLLLFVICLVMTRIGPNIRDIFCVMPLNILCNKCNLATCNVMSPNQKGNISLFWYYVVIAIVCDMSSYDIPCKLCLYVPYILMYVIIIQMKNSICVWCQPTKTRWFEMCVNIQNSMHEFLKLFCFKSFLHYIFQNFDSDCGLKRRLVHLVMLPIDFFINAIVKCKCLNIKYCAYMV